MTALLPRVVIVRRPSDLELLIEEHGTREQAKFYLDHQGERIELVEARHATVAAALDTIARAIPRSWRSVSLLRAELDRFVFEEHDIVAAVGQDGLVANVAKYLDGQYVIGINPDRREYEGVLVPHDPEAVGDLLADCANGRCRTETRSMVEASLDDGQRLLALNEIFVGHRSHQSARYRIDDAGSEERQSSSGIIVSTGTGCTGWARSISLERHDPLPLPAPEDPLAVYFVREAFPGSGFATKLTAGVLRDRKLRVISEMHSQGTIFGDGIEDDRLEFHWGARADIGIARERLQLVA